LKRVILDWQAIFQKTENNGKDLKINIVLFFKHKINYNRNNFRFKRTQLLIF